MTAVCHPKAGGKPLEIHGPEASRTDVIWLTLIPAIAGAPPQAHCFLYTHTDIKKKDENGEPLTHYREVDGVMIEQRQNILVPGNGHSLPPLRKLGGP